MKQESISWSVVYFSILFLIIITLSPAGAVVASTNNSTSGNIYSALWELEDLSEIANLPSNNGKLINNVTIMSSDEKASLEIPKGAIVRDSLGFPLYLVRINAIELGAIASYDIGPNGATFSSSGNSSKLNILYDPSKIPDGANETDLFIKKYEKNEWKPVVSEINTTTHTVTTSVIRSAVYSVFAEVTTSNNNTTVEAEGQSTQTQTTTTESTSTPSNSNPNLKPAVWGEDTESTEDEEVEEETPGFTAIIAFTAVLTAVFLNKRLIKPR
ncbi:MAG: hypothetical protein SVK08_06555 [Halobacteriota archaeon]|nr:hypothetical protein [Halobacteriota archaeon]